MQEAGEVVGEGEGVVEEEGFYGGGGGEGGEVGGGEGRGCRADGVGVGGRVEDGVGVGGCMAADGGADGGADDMAAGEYEGAARYEIRDGRMVVEGPLNTSGKGRSVTENVDEK